MSGAAGMLVRACLLPFALAFLALFTLPARAADVPFLSGRVVDNAEILGPATRAGVTDKLKAHEEKTGNQIAVLTVPTIGSDSIEEYATRVFESWKLGEKDKDNGVLVVVAPKDRKMRIEVGYGLEGTLTDVGASRIIRNVMTPAFKNNDFDKGVSAGVDAIVGQLEGTLDVAKLADVSSSSSSTSRNSFPMDFNDPSLPPWPMRILLGCFIFGIIGLFTFMGIVTPGMGW
ncbi:MAG: YgcG family protein, partial [Casimicrobiaceae bacterium]